MIDLHIHTLFSDGQYTPEEIATIAKESGVSAFAITDHDTVAGIARGKEASDNLGIEFVSGIEISCQGNRELHILGYNIDSENPELLSACNNFAQFREDRAEKIIEYLKNKSIYVTMEDVMEVEDNITLISRNHFARVMVKKGYVETTREAFDKYLGTAEFDKVERPKPFAKEGIELVLKAGGVPVLAHPCLLKISDVELEELICELISYGLRGIESYYSLNTPEQTAYYNFLALRYGLIQTGGSDFHGEKYKPNIKIGTGINGSLFFNDKEIIGKLGVR